MMKQTPLTAAVMVSLLVFSVLTGGAAEDQTAGSVVIPPDARKVRNAGDFAAALWKANPLTGKELKDWSLLGPFDGEGIRSLGVKYAPEEKLNLAAECHGSEGARIRWVKWKTGTKMPVARTGEDSVIYAHGEFAASGFTCLSISASDSVKVWLDNRIVLVAPDLQGRRTYVCVDLKPGTHKLMLKIHQKSGLWSFRVGLSPSDLRATEIDMRRIMAEKFPGDRAGLMKHSERLAVLLADTGDPAGASKWFGQIVANARNDTPTRIALSDLIAEIPGKAAELFMNEIRNACDRTQEPLVKALFADTLVKYATSQGDTRTVADAIRRYRIAIPIEKTRELVTTAFDQNDKEGVRFWVAFMLRNEKKLENLDILIRDFVPRLPPDIIEDFYAGIVTGYLTTDDEDRREYIVARLIESALERNEPKTATDFLRKCAVAATHKQAMAIVASFKRGGLYTEKSCFDWLKFYFQSSRDREETAAVIKDMQAISDSAQLALLADSLHVVFRSAGNRDGRMFFGNRYVDVCLFRGDSSDVISFVDRNRQLLNGGMEFDAALWKVRAYIVEGNIKAATDALESAASLKRGFKNSATYNSWAGLIRLSQKNLARPFSVETNFSAAVRAIPSGEEGHPQVFKLLAEKSATVIPSAQDSLLYTGVKSACRKALAPLQKPYAGYIAQYEKTLVKKGVSAGDAAHVARSLSLAAPAAKPGSPVLPSASIKDVRPSGRAGTFRSLIQLNLGLHELAAVETTLVCGGPLTPVFSTPLVVNDVTYVQNSSGLAAMSGDKVLWTLGVPLADAGVTNAVRRHLGSVSSPALAGGVVAGRFAARECMTLAGVDSKTGLLLWTCMPENLAIVSDPAPWGTSHVCALALDKQDNWSSMLVVVNALTGAEAGRVRISRAPDRAALGARNVQPELNAPAPSVAGDYAFVDTSFGAVAAVNLADLSVVWLRTYARDTSGKSTAFRMPSRPVIGSTNVVFAPADGTSIILAARNNGRLVSRTSCVAWQDIHRAGGNSVAAVTPYGATFLSLDDLSIVATMRGPRYRFVQELADGCILNSDRNVAAYDSGGKEKWSITTSFSMIPSFCTGNRLFGFARTDPSLFGFMTEEKRDASWKMHVVPVKSMAAIDVQSTEGVKAGNLSRGKQSAAWMGAGGKIKWEIPVLASADTGIIGDYVAVAQAGQVALYEQNTGRRKKLWPMSYGPRSFIVKGMWSAGNEMYASLVSKWDRGFSTGIVKIPAEGEPTLVGEFAGDIGRFLVSTGGRYVMDQPEYSRCRLFKLNNKVVAPKVPYYSEMGHVTSKRTDLWMAYVSGSDELWVFEKSRRDATRFVDGRKTELRIAGEGVLWSETPTQVDGLFFFRRNDKRPERNQLAIFESRSTQTQILKGSPSWLMTEGCVHAVSRHSPEGINTFVPQVMTIGKAGLSSVTSGDSIVDPFSGNMHMTDPCRIGNSVVLGVYSPKWRREEGGMPSYLLVQRVGSAETSIKPFPYLTSCLEIGGSSALINGITVSGAVLSSCLDMSGIVHKLTGDADKQASIALDGRLNEWRDAEFVSVPNGRYAIRANGAQTWIAMESKAPAVIAEAKEFGVNNITFEIGPGAFAGFARGWDGCGPQEVGQWNEFRLSGSHTSEQFKAALALADDGSALSVEIQAKDLPGAVRPVVRQTRSLHLGCERNGKHGVNFFNGKIDEVRIYSRALPLDELLQLEMARDITEGCERYWSFDEISGDSAVDRAGKTSSRVTDARWVSGKKFGALSFNGRNSQVECSRPALRGNFTIAAWIYLDPASSLDSDGYLISNGAWHDDFSLAVIKGKPRFAVGRRFVEAQQPLERGKWYFVMAVLDGITMKLYPGGAGGLCYTAAAGKDYSSEFGDFAFRALWQRTVLNPPVNMLLKNDVGPFSFVRVSYGD